MKKKLIRW